MTVSTFIVTPSEKRRRRRWRTTAYNAKIRRILNNLPVFPKKICTSKKLHGDPRSVTNVGVGTMFLYRGMGRNITGGTILRIAMKKSLSGCKDFNYLLCNTGHTVTLWVSAFQLKNMIEGGELRKIPPAVHRHAFPVLADWTARRTGCSKCMDST